MKSDKFLLAALAISACTEDAARTEPQFVCAYEIDDMVRERADFISTRLTELAPQQVAAAPSSGESSRMPDTKAPIRLDEDIAPNDLAQWREFEAELDRRRDQIISRAQDCSEVSTVRVAWLVEQQIRLRLDNP